MSHCAVCRRDSLCALTRWFLGNVALVAAEAAVAQVSASRETQQVPLSPQEETQMSKYDIDGLVSVVSVIVVLYMSYQN